VLVQRQLDAPAGGVLFSVDPVSGDDEHLMVEVVPARPDRLVGGSVTAAHYVMSKRGRIVEQAHVEVARPLSRRDRRVLATLARRAERAFEGPQDIEWAFDTDGKLWLLQARPITARAEPPTKGCLMGPGPVAETFPSPLRRLEDDLFVAPLRAGITRALTATATVSKRRLRSSPVVTTVGGWVAADLGLLGIETGRARLRRRVDPFVVTRRLIAAWRVGRLRVALPQLARSVVATVDRDLAAVGDLHHRSDTDLVDVVERALVELSTVHAFEVLAGMLLDDRTKSPPAALLALGELARGRAESAPDSEIIRRAPVVLALLPPSIVRPTELPAGTRAPTEVGGDLDSLNERDALRLRSRWLQELIVRTVRTLGVRFASRYDWPQWRWVAEMRWCEVTEVAHGHAPPEDLGARAAERPGPPLPRSFRLTATGSVVHVAPHDDSAFVGIAAGGGRGEGLVRQRFAVDGTDAGIVLVTQHLEPQLASLLPALDGLVSETGSALSHLAILAREMKVPTVAGVEGATKRFPPGTRLLVDGDLGLVEVLETANDDRSLEEVTR
jgi:pyruvate,water dikinase